MIKHCALLLLFKKNRGGIIVIRTLVGQSGHHVIVMVCTGIFQKVKQENHGVKEDDSRINGMVVGYCEMILGYVIPVLVVASSPRNMEMTGDQIGVGCSYSKIMRNLSTYGDVSKIQEPFEATK